MFIMVCLFGHIVKFWWSLHTLCELCCLFVVHKIARAGTAASVLTWKHADENFTTLVRKVVSQLLDHLFCLKGFHQVLEVKIMVLMFPAARVGFLSALLWIGTRISSSRKFVSISQEMKQE